MKRILFKGLIKLLLISAVFNVNIYLANSQTFKIIPKPVSLVSKSGYFEITPETKLFINKKDSVGFNIAGFLNKKLKSAAGFELFFVDTLPKENAIIFMIDSTKHIEPEGYHLTISSTLSVIESKTPQGAFYALQTMFQLLPVGIDSKVQIEQKWIMPCVTIEDYPRFEYRGFMLDVCRHFFSIDCIKKQMDVMARYKLNTFHWHLTDDQGWRIEIKHYPKLIDIGSKRIEADGSVYEGHYSQDDVRDIVRYAQERYINIIPEIEMPGHAMAALSAYPEYSCTGGPFSVMNTWGSDQVAFCAGNDQTYDFIDNIISEIATLFPSPYIHIGGDECQKHNWRVCHKCQMRIRKSGLKNVNELQSFFIKRVEKIVLSHGKKLIGWDEILEGGLAGSAIVMSWQSEKGGIAAAKKDHQVIMTPQRWLYIDHYQGADKVEPTALRGLVTLSDVYQYDPETNKLNSEKQHNVLGSQVNLWTEYIPTQEHLEYMAYPRMLALAETDWTPTNQKDFLDFTIRLDNQFPRLDLMKIHYHIPMPEGPCNLEVFQDTLKLKFTVSRPVKMLYTLDGTDPDLDSRIYTNEIVIDSNVTVKIRSALPTGELSTIRTIQTLKQTPFPATSTTSLPGLFMRLIPGKYYKVNEIDTNLQISHFIVYNLKYKFHSDSPSAAIISGYLEVPVNGKYYFSTESDKLWIDGNLLVSNEGEIKNHSRNDGSILLKQGKHLLKIIFLNNIIGGRPSSLNGIKLFYRIEGENTYSLVKPKMLSH